MSDPATGPGLNLMDDTFVAVAPEQVAARVADPVAWRRWWPDLALESSRDRGIKGHQWVVTGPLRGTAEIWLEPWRDGTLMHCFLRLQTPASWSRARRLREERLRALAWKRRAFAVKDELEGGRRAGAPAVGAR